jgi:GTPase SAR1 family protein
MEQYHIPPEVWNIVLQHLIDTSVKDITNAKLVCHFFLEEINSIILSVIKMDSDVLAYFRGIKNLAYISESLKRAKDKPANLDFDYDRSSPLTIRVLMIGAHLAGKTMFMQTFFKDRDIRPHMPYIKPWLETNFDMDYEGQSLTANFMLYDTLPQDRFLYMISRYYKEVNVIMLSFSLDDPNSLETLKQEWLKHCYEHRDDMKNQIYYCMLGLKSDLVKPNCLLSRRAKLLASHLKMSYFEASSVNNQNVLETMNKIHLHFRALLAECNRLGELDPPIKKRLFSFVPDMPDGPGSVLAGMRCNIT